MKEYWQNLAGSVGVAKATGLGGGVEYVADVEAALATLDFTLSGRVLDIGCGTGRLAELATDYTGVDIAPAMVEYATSKGRNAALITGPESLADYPSFDRICMLSVFTHVPRDVRQAYLRVIADHLTTDGEAMVTVFLGAEGGGIGFTVSDASAFSSDMAAVGLRVIKQFESNYDGTGAHTVYRMGRVQ